MWRPRWRAVEADDPAPNRCGCFLPDLTRLATAPPADFREAYGGTCLRVQVRVPRSAALHSRFTSDRGGLPAYIQGLADASPRPLPGVACSGRWGASFRVDADYGDRTSVGAVHQSDGRAVPSA